MQTTWITSPVKSLRNLTLVSCALFMASPAVAAGDPNGTWKFKAEAGGRSLESTLTLRWAGRQLTGSIENRAGKADITEASFTDDEVTFTVVRTLGKRLRKKTFTVHYAGKLEGDTIKGTIETADRDKQPVSIAWEAQRAK